MPAQNDWQDELAGCNGRPPIGFTCAGCKRTITNRPGDEVMADENATMLCRTCFHRELKLGAIVTNTAPIEPAGSTPFEILRVNGPNNPAVTTESSFTTTLANERGERIEMLERQVEEGERVIAELGADNATLTAEVERLNNEMKKLRLAGFRVARFHFLNPQVAQGYPPLVIWSKELYDLTKREGGQG